MAKPLRPLAIFGIVLLVATPLVVAKPVRKEGKSEPAVEMSDYYPLHLGNQWTFRAEVAGTSTQAVSKIAKIETVGGMKTACLEASVNGAVVTSENLYANAKGVFRSRIGGQEISPPLCLFKYPAKSGATWEGDLTIGAESGHYSCECKEDNVAVAAGKYKAMKVSIVLDVKGQSVATTYWFVKDVGFVKQTVDAAGLRIVIDLEKFESGKKKKSATETK